MKKMFGIVCAGLFAAGSLVAKDALKDESPKPNFGFGKETQIRSVEALGAAVNAKITKETPYLVLLTDLHLYSRADIGKKEDAIFSKDVRGDLNKLTELLNGLTPAPALLVIAGDLTHTGTEDQYRELREILQKISPEIPVLAIPGNHDDPALMRKILGERLNGGSVRNVGNWAVIGLDTGKKGMLSAPERKNLHAALEQAGDKPVMIVTHHTPVQQPGWEPVRTLREQLAEAVETRNAATWLVSGHAHANFLMRMRYEQMPDIPVLTHTAGTSCYGYDSPSLRILFLGEKDVTASAIWRYTAPDCGFRIDPPVGEWPLYTPVARDPNRELLNVDREKQKELALVRKGVGEHADYDYVDADGCLLLALPVAQYAANAPLTLELDLESDYIVRAGGSEKRLGEIFNSGKRQQRQTLRWRIPEELQHGILYLEIRDRTPQDGFGAFLHGIRLLGVRRK